jgi:hypothetical protein
VGSHRPYSCIFFLLVAGTLVLRSARRVLGWSAIAIGLLTLAGAAAPANGLAENTVLLWFVWIIWATTFLARGEQATAVVAARGAVPICRRLKRRERRDSNPRPPA